MSFKESDLRVSPFFGQSLLSENNTNQTECSLNPLTINNMSISSLSDIESWEHSSVSSLSWFDEYDLTSSIKISQELKNIDKVLYGEENLTILQKNIQLECEEWMRAFPHLRVCGKSLINKNTKPTNVTESTNERLFSNIPTTDEFHNLETLNLEGLSLINKTKFRQKYENIWEKDNESFVKMFQPHDCLSVTSTQNHHNHFPSAPSIIRSEISSSKWHRQETSEYSSLPFILDIPNSFITNDKLPELYFSERKTRLTLKEKNKSNDQNKKLKVNKSKRCSSTMSKNNYSQTFSTQSKPFLPPIENASSMNKLYCNSFRSISATPRKYIPLLPMPKSSNRNKLDEILSSQTRKQFENKYNYLSQQNTNKSKCRNTPK